jgi:dolichol-phosphate mannosyltransferase
MQDSSEISLSVLILAINEAPNLQLLLPKLIAEVRQVTKDCEILVLDGGSVDNTSDVAKSFGCRIVTQTEKGYGNAFRQGLKECSKNFILTLDADMSHPPSYLAEMRRLVSDNDIIIASRYCYGGGFEMPRHRVILSRALNSATRILFGMNISDWSSGFRMYRSSFIKTLKLQANHFDVLIEALIKAKKSGARITEIPFTYKNRNDGVSKARIIPFGLGYIRTFFRLSVGI